MENGKKRKQNKQNRTEQNTGTLVVTAPGMKLTLQTVRSCSFFSGCMLCFSNKSLVSAAFQYHSLKKEKNKNQPLKDGPKHKDGSQFY